MVQYETMKRRSRVENAARTSEYDIVCPKLDSGKSANEDDGDDDDNEDCRFCSVFAQDGQREGVANIAGGVADSALS